MGMTISRARRIKTPNFSTGLIPDRRDSFLRSRQHWAAGIAIAALLAFITSLPQFYLYYARGSEWNGSCAYLDTDEFAYAAYTNALIDGRPRRSDPYTGKDDSQSETLFSIQFLPAYALALPAKTLGISASTAFIFILPLACIAAVFMLLWFFLELTENITLAAVGTVGVLCLSTIAALSPLQILNGLQDGGFFFPFLRRYVPALAFPVFIASTLFMVHWQTSGPHEGVTYLWNVIRRRWDCVHTLHLATNASVQNYRSLAVTGINACTRSVPCT